jgi:hypothetical protein
MTGPSTDSVWRDGLQRVNDEAAGLLDISIIDAWAGAELVVDAALGPELTKHPSWYA